MDIKDTLKKVVIAGVFIIPFIPFLVFSSFFFPFITSKAFAFRIIVEVVFALWIPLALIGPEYRPRWSWISKSLILFLAVIGLANILGVAPLKSFWSNFERMEGYIALIHFGMYYFVITSVLIKDRYWKYFWNTTIVASVLMVCYSAFQLAGAIPINQGGVRVDGTLGNASYLAAYMLFHIFLTTYMYVKEQKGSGWRIFYPIAVILQTWILYYTATRGAILGAIGGLILFALLEYFGEKENKRVKKIGGIVLISVLIFVGIFALVKNTSFVEQSPVLSRFSSISISEVKNQGRYFIWPMAIEGLKEKPLLGWGQENFNYVFNSHYNPKMYAHEQWFDRAHNIVLDWAIAGGILGLVSYLLIIVSLVYTIWRRETFKFTEKAILTGLVAAYFFQNLFVFDNLTSYMLFFSLLGYVHVRSVEGMSTSSIKNKVIDQSAVYATGILVALLAVVGIYVWNIKPIKANTTLINAIRSSQVSTVTQGSTTELFKQASSMSRLGRPEVREQMLSATENILNSSLSTEKKNEYVGMVKEEILAQIDELPTDARYYLLAGSFFSKVGLDNEAIEHLEKAKELSPNKQAIYFEIGATEINQGNVTLGLESLRQALQLAPEYEEARVAYFIGALFAKDEKVVQELLPTIRPERIISDQRISNALLATGRTQDLIAVLNQRIKANPADPEAYAALVNAYVRLGDKISAKEVLRALAEKIPQYKAEAEDYIRQLDSGTGN